MSARDFYFALDVTGAPESKTSAGEMMSDLVARVLERAGGAGADAAGLTRAIQGALAKGLSGREPCRVQFQSRDGRLHIVVSSRAGEIWQTTRDIPRKQ